MQWIPDPDTLFWANRTRPNFLPFLPHRAFPVNVRITAKRPRRFPKPTPATQFQGHKMSQSRWLKYVNNVPFPKPHNYNQSHLNSLVSSPANIINCFRHGHWLHGLAMVVSWGTMWRQNKRIYRVGLPIIGPTLMRVNRHIQKSARTRKHWSITVAWPLLTGSGSGKLNWSSVTASKTLHFLCRSLGISHDPPVPIDGAVMRKCLWPSFKGRIIQLQKIGMSGRMPQNWDGDSWNAYNRFMTAINAWAKWYGWTNTQIETTIFSICKNGQLSWI